MQDGKALQVGGHFLGQNFAKARDLRRRSGGARLDHRLGVSTRLMGTLADPFRRQGLVLPPKLAPTRSSSPSRRAVSPTPWSTAPARSSTTT